MSNSVPLDTPNPLIEAAHGLSDPKEMMALLSRESALSGGSGCVERALRQAFNRALTQAQAQDFWSSCKVWMLANGEESSAQEAEESRGGLLDTYPREGVHDAIGMTLAGAGWPANMTPQAETDLFYENAFKEIEKRGYARLLSLEQVDILYPGRPEAAAKSKASP